MPTRLAWRRFALKTSLLFFIAGCGSKGTTDAPLDGGRDARHDAPVLPAVDATRDAFADAAHIDAGRPPPPVDGATGTRDTGHDAGGDAQRDTGRGDTGVDATTGVDAEQPDDSGVDADGIPDVIIVGDVIDIGPPPEMDATLPDAANDGPKLNACGICDRTWICNGAMDSGVLTFPFVSTSADSCAYIRGTTTAATLWCADGMDTIDYADDPSVGTWHTTPTGIELDFDSFGTTMVFLCVPPS